MIDLKMKGKKKLQITPRLEKTRGFTISGG